MNRFERHPRSKIMLNLVGSVRLAPDFPHHLIPSIFHHLQVYTVIDRSHRSIHPHLTTQQTLQREHPPAIDDISRHYVVKRLVDQTLGISIKTIDNYFRKKDDDTICIGYVVHSNRIPHSTKDILSPSNHYLLISLDYLKEWYTHSLIVMKLINRNKAPRWITESRPISTVDNTADTPVSDQPDAAELVDAIETIPVENISSSSSMHTSA
jgi:hypothetical protein